MTVGQYTKRKSNFKKYIAPNFPFYQSDLYVTGSCGEDAYYTLTGKTFTKKQQQEYKNELTPKQMLQLLRKNGYTVIPLSICKVTNTKYNKILTNTIKENHVVLNRQLMYRGESSWSITTRNLYCHNKYWERPHLTEFINRPIISSYLVWHKKWT